MLNIEKIKLTQPEIQYQERDPGIDILIQKYGPDYSLNLSQMGNYSIPLSFTFVTDKNGHVNIENYEQQKYKYKYIIAKDLLQKSRDFTMDCLALMNLEYDRIPMKKQPFDFNIDFNKVYYGIQQEVYNASYDEISDEEFNDEMSLSRSETSKLHDISSTVVKDIDEFIQTVPRDFWTKEDCLFYSENYQASETFGLDKKVSGALRTIKSVFV